MQEFIPLMVPDIQETDITQVVEVLRSGMLVQGKKVAQFERHIEEFLQIKNAVAVANGTASLHLALVALGIGEGDEVIVPAFSYIATANVVEIVKAKPVFVDIKITDFNIDATRIEQAITPKTKALIVVHEFGLACDITQIIAIAKKHNLKIIEDAACALGATENNQNIGTFGDVASFSLHPRKAITCGEGGILVTNNSALAQLFTCLRNHGIEMDNSKMEFIAAGFNYRMTDFQAALVNNQLQRLPTTLEYKRKLATVYLDELKNIATLQLPQVEPHKTHTWQTFHVVLDKSLHRNDCIAYMKEKQVGTNNGAQCMPAQKYYTNKYQLDCRALYPNAMNAYEQGLALPLYERMSEVDVRYVATQLKQFIQQHH